MWRRIIRLSLSLMYFIRQHGHLFNCWLRNDLNNFFAASECSLLKRLINFPARPVSMPKRVRGTLASRVKAWPPHRSSWVPQAVIFLVQLAQETCTSDMLSYASFSCSGNLQVSCTECNAALSIPHKFVQERASKFDASFYTSYLGFLSGRI